MLSQLTKKLSALLLIVVLVSTGFVQAQDETDQGLAIRPAIIDEVVEPDKTSEITIELENITSNAIAIEAEVEELLVVDPFVNLADKIRFDVSRWVEFEQSNWALGPFENVTVKIRISPPEDATPGGHYAQIAFKAIKEESIAQSSSADVIPQLNSLLLLTVPGEVFQDISIKNLDLSGISFTSKVDSLTTVANLGNSHEIIRVSGKVQDGDEVKTIEVDPRIILPGTSQEYPLVFDSSKLFSRSKVWTEITFGSPARTIISDKHDVVFISPYLMLAVVLVIVFMSSLIGRKSKKKIYSHMSKRSYSGRRYSHPRRKSERKLIKLGK